MDTMAKARNTPPAVWSDSSSYATTSRVSIRHQRSWTGNIRTATCRWSTRRTWSLIDLKCWTRLKSIRTPANYFHVLRRQNKREFRKPVNPCPDVITTQLTCMTQLIVFFSKSLLRHPLARSTLSEMMDDTVFQRYIPDPHPDSLVEPEKIRRHILCTGQVYYQLLKEREDKKIDDVVISRLEQLSPLPYELLTPHLDKYPNADLVWAQEEVSPVTVRKAMR